MHNIGNVHDAQTIHYWVTSQRREYGRPTCIDDKQAPEGWEYIASGSFRSVWLSPTGVAYKVEHYSGEWCRQSAREIANLEYAWGQGAPEGCRLPKFNKFEIGDETVVVIEYISGEILCRYRGESRVDLYERLSKCEARYNLSDLHDENVIVDADGYLVPVDLGG